MRYVITFFLFSLPILGFSNGNNPQPLVIEMNENSIEAKTPCCATELDIVQVGDPVLRGKARELSKEEILSPEIQTLIEDMKATMLAAPGVGLAAPQIGIPIQLAVIEDMNLSHLNPEQLAELNRNPVPFHTIINPRIYIEEESDQFEFFEGCLSVPGLLGVVSRATSVYVECLNEKAEPITIHATGWYARILQHEIDHLNGTLYLDRAEIPTLITIENYIKMWKGKPVQEIMDSCLGLKDQTH